MTAVRHFEGFAAHVTHAAGWLTKYEEFRTFEPAHMSRSWNVNEAPRRSSTARNVVSAACVGGSLLLATACSSNVSTAEVGLGHVAARIINGTPSTADQDAVVLLALRPEGGMHGTCTGTLVAPNLVLTARHCVADTDHGALCSAAGTAVSEGVVRTDFAASDIYVYTGVSGVADLSDPSKAAARGKQLVHESVSTLCNADVAFIVLDQSVQGRIATLRMTGGARVGEKLTAVGWGLTQGGTLPTQRMQRANVGVMFVGPVTFDSNMNVGLGDSEFLVGEAFCSGDSGGPSFSSKGAVVGVVSRGGGGAENPENQAANCVGSNVFNFYTHLAEKPALVAQAFAAAGAQPRTEGDPPGVGVGESCKVHVDCSSDACIEGKCARRCDDGTKCAASEVCDEIDDKEVCVKAPVKPPPAPPEPAPEAEAPVAATPTPTTATTTTTKSGCSATPSSSSSGGIGFVFSIAAAFVALRRRRAR